MARKYEIAFWVFFYGLMGVVNATSNLIEYERNNLHFETWEPFVWEFSSGILLLFLVPLVIGFDRYFPFSSRTWKKSLPAHLLFTLPYSLLHVGGMVALRKIIYGQVNRTYDFGNIPVELFYEYRKDLLAYAFVLIVLYVYRYIRAQHLGDCREVASENPQRDPPKFLVRHRDQQIIVPARDIIWLEGAGNYVLLHMADHCYAHRATMQEMVEKLAPFGFVRSHKSAIVNMNRVSGLAAGSSCILLEEGIRIPLGRHYREKFQSQLGLAS